MKNKILKRVLLSLGAFVVLLLCTILTAFIKLGVKTGNMLDDYSGIYTSPKYQNAVSIDGVSSIKQDVSCGYAVIEMFAKWAGHEDITEESLYDKYDAVVTSTGKSFENEMNKQFPEYHTTMYANLKNTELIDKVYASLAAGVPVAFEWAAKLDNEWTLHYSLLVGLDMKNDLATILNPYGYEERISIGELLDRTSFEAYTGMPLFLQFGFAFDIFEKNTIFVAKRRD